MGHIQGQDRNQLILFPECIEDYISSDNMVRVIDEFIEQTDLKKLGFTRTESNEFGRSSYSSKPLSKLYLYGYMNSVRSSRKLEREARRNVELMWLLGKLTPDHQTIARFRKENAKALKRLFRSFVKMCNELGMYGKEMIATDGSKFEAVNATDRNFNDKKLNERIAKIEEKIEAYMQMLQEEDKREEQNDTTLIKDTTAILTQLIERKAKYENYRDYLTETENTQISETDPDSRRMQSNGRSDMCYNIQHSIDAKHKLVVEFEVTNQANDINQLSNMTERSAEILDAQGICSVADKGYDNATEIAKCIMQGHNPQVIGTDFDLCITTDSPEPQITNHHEGRCVYLEDRNIVLCPMGKILYPSSYKNKKGNAIFRNSHACANCACKCTTSKCKVFEIRMRKEKFSKEYKDENLYVKQVRIQANPEVCAQRKSLAEHPFGTLKRNMGMGYVLTKGIEMVTGEFSLAYLAYNLKRAVSIMGAEALINAMKNRNNDGFFGFLHYYGSLNKFFSILKTA